MALELSMSIRGTLLLVGEALALLELNHDFGVLVQLKVAPNPDDL
jgi:hypothetical protein